MSASQTLQGNEEKILYTLDNSYQFISDMIQISSINDINDINIFRDLFRIHILKKLYDSYQDTITSLQDTVLTPLINEIVKTLKSVDYTKQRDSIIDDLPDGSIVYVLGDLEGKIDMMYKFLFAKNLLKYDKGIFTWVGAENVYVIQCGDQLDSKMRVDFLERCNDHFDIDIGVFVFMEFLYILSNGRVISILGNHDLLITDDNNRYYHKDDTNVKINDNLSLFRTNFFNESTIFKNILNNRFVFFKINNIIFSHAGSSYLFRDIDGNREYESDKLNAIYKTNNIVTTLRRNISLTINNNKRGLTTKELNNRINNKIMLYNQNLRDANYKLIHPIVWSRYYDVDNERDIIMGGYIYVIGHNTRKQITLIMKENSTNGTNSIYYTDVNRYHSFCSKPPNQCNIQSMSEPDLTLIKKYNCNSLIGFLTIKKELPPKTTGGKKSNYVYFVNENKKKVRKTLYSISGKDKVIDGKTSKNKPKYVTINTYKKKYHLKSV
jgi:hypothetical protein